MSSATRSKARGKKNTTATPSRTTRSAGSGNKKKLPASDASDGDKPKKKQKKSNEQPPTGKQQPNAGTKITMLDLYTHAGSEFDSQVSQKKEAARKPKRRGGGRGTNRDKGELVCYLDVLLNV